MHAIPSKDSEAPAVRLGPGPAYRRTECCHCRRGGEPGFIRCHSAGVDVHRDHFRTSWRSLDVYVQATAVSAQPVFGGRNDDRSSAMIRVSIIPGPRAGPSGLQGHLHPEAIRRRAQCPLRPARGLPTSASRQSYKDSRDDNAGGDEDGRGGGCRGIGLVRGPR
jgi:hypothetical protein